MALGLSVNGNSFFLVVIEILLQRTKINYVKVLRTHGYTGFASHNNRLDLMTNVALISSLSRIIVNFNICSIISIYLASNLVFDVIHLHTAIDIVYTSQHKTDQKSTVNKTISYTWVVCFL